jgi:hypothetical protein
MTAKREARTLNEFVERVEEFKAALWDHYGERVDPWFRGISSSNHSLVPGAYRTVTPSFDEDDYRYEFQLRSFPYLSEVPVSPRTEWDWYFLMQHYGLPTRLLDWSESSLVALFFAVRNPLETDAAVWLMDPFGFNKVVARVDVIPIATDARARRYLAEPYAGAEIPEAPLAIQPPFHSRRIFAQKGMFTVHGSDRKGLEEHHDLESHLVRVVIPEDAWWTMRDQLATAGISETTLFPELSSLSRDLIAQYAEAPVDDADSEARSRRQQRRRQRRTR